MSDLETPQEKISKFMNRNFPQIRMHGGESSIVDIDESEETVHIQLSGACSGCGISPMTIQAIKRRLTSEIQWISTVKVTTGMGAAESTPRINRDLVDNETDNESNEEETESHNAPF